MAALLVVCFHAGGTLFKQKYFGDFAETIERFFRFGGEAGVAFFFVLSGFIIYHVHQYDLSNPKRLPVYLLKRMIRIYPSYLIVFVVVFLGAYFTPSLRDTVPHDWVIILKSILLLPQDKAIVGGTGAPVLVVAWSLQYELVFYIAFALGIVRAWLFYPLVAMYLFGFVYHYYIGAMEFPFSFLNNHMIALFLFGIIAAILNSKSIEFKFHKALSLLSLVGFFGVAYLSYIYNSESDKVFIDMGYGMFGAMLIFSLTQLEKSTAIGWLSNFKIFGDSSYSLYLIHFPLVSVVCKIAVNLFAHDVFGAWLSFVIIVVTSVTVSVIFYFLIERPLLRRLSLSLIRKY